MEIHKLKPKQKPKEKKRIGRGGKRGTYSGRGLKGQKARSGHNIEPIIRKLVKKYPKLRGYNNSQTNKKIVTEINIAILDKNFKDGDKVTPEILVEKKIIRSVRKKIPTVKILGQGETKKKLIISCCKISKTAKEKLEKTKSIIKI
jgi:large subunit ribosomal protein L15